MRAVTIVVIALTVSACSITATIIPVEGPLALQRPVPTVFAKADGVLGRAGNLTFTMPDEDDCAGRWSVVAATSEATVATTSLITRYGPVYGISTAHSQGHDIGRAIATCASGNVVEVEFLSTGGHGFGIAKDLNGNVFKFIF